MIDWKHVTPDNTVTFNMVYTMYCYYKLRTPLTYSTVSITCGVLITNKR